MVTKNGVFQDEFFGTGFFHINGKKRRKKEKQLFLSEQLLSLLCWRTPIFPGRHQPSIFGTNELNFRVRDGNGWTLVVINTNYSLSSGSPDSFLIIPLLSPNCKHFFRDFYIFLPFYHI